MFSENLIGKVVDFFSKSSTQKSVVVALIVFGGGGIFLGILGPGRVTGAWRYVSFICGIVLISAAIVLFSVTVFQTWLKRRFVDQAMTLIQEQTNDIVKKACEQLDTHNQTLLKAAATALGEETKALQSAQTELVNKVEDATRRLLTGIPEIFARAYGLIQTADREIWLVNLALQFGKVHCENKSVTAIYKRDFHSDFRSDVDRFYDALELKVKQLPIVNILTISSDAARAKFIDPLLRKDEYKSLKDIDDETGLQRWEVLLKDMGKKRSKFIEEFAESHKQRFKNSDEAHQYRYYELPSLSIQLLITGIAPNVTGSHKKYGCLVFMLGSETRAATEPGQEVGIYTELENMVDVMKNLAWTLMRNEAPLCYETDPNLFVPTAAIPVEVSGQQGGNTTQLQIATGV